MPINVIVRKFKDNEIRSVNCPVCSTGQMRYKITNGKKEFDFECSVCRTVGNSDWFDIMLDTKVGRENRIEYHIGEDKFLPMC